MNGYATMFRFGGPILLLAGLLFAAAGLLVLATALGTAAPGSGLLYFLGLLLCAPAYAAWYAASGPRAGSTGSVGFILGTTGAVGYAVGAFLLLPVDAGVEGAREVWIFASVSTPVLPIGGVAFFVGSMLLAAASLRSPALPRSASMLASVGFAIWLVAFFTPPELAWLLTLGNLLVAAGIGRIGWAIWSRPMEGPAT